MNSSERIDEQECEQKPLFRVTLMRHEETGYTDVGRDLTSSGEEEARVSGKTFAASGRISPDDNNILFHSPKARAQGTLELVAEGAGISHEDLRKIDQLRSSDLLDSKAFMARVEEFNFDQEAVAKDHYTNPMYEERPDIIEPASHKKERLYRTFEYLIRSFDKGEEDDRLTHVIAVSHFEMITHLIDDVFGIENVGKYNAPSFGEAVEIDAFRTDDPGRILLHVGYGGETKTVFFNRTDRSVEVSE